MIQVSIETKIRLCKFIYIVLFDSLFFLSTESNHRLKTDLFYPRADFLRAVIQMNFHKRQEEIANADEYRLAANDQSKIISRVDTDFVTACLYIRASDFTRLYSRKTDGRGKFCGFS